MPASRSRASQRSFALDGHRPVAPDSAGAQRAVRRVSGADRACWPRWPYAKAGHAHGPNGLRPQRGLALMLAILVLLIATVVALGAVRGAVVQERLAANANAHAAARLAADEGLALLHQTLATSWRPAGTTWTEYLGAKTGAAGVTLSDAPAGGCQRRYRVEVDEAASHRNRLVADVVGACMTPDAGTTAHVDDAFALAHQRVVLSRGVTGQPVDDRPLTCQDVVAQRAEDVQPNGSALSVLFDRLPALVPGLSSLGALDTLDKLQVALAILHELNLDSLDALGGLYNQAQAVAQVGLNPEDGLDLGAGLNDDLQALGIAQLGLCLLADVAISPRDGVNLDVSANVLVDLYNHNPVLQPVLDPVLSPLVGPVQQPVCQGLINIVCTVVNVSGKVQLLNPNAPSLVSLDLDLLTHVDVLNRLGDLGQLPLLAQVNLIPTGRNAEEQVVELINDDAARCAALGLVGLSHCTVSPQVRLARIQEIVASM